MPKLSDELWSARRRQVLESAFRCFARSGFHGTTVEDVVAESGLSSSVVYRYVRSKEEMIAASVQETLSLYAAMADDLLAADPVPTPGQAVRAIVATFDDERNGRGYNLRGLVIQTWAEAIRRPEIGEQARATSDHVRRRLTTLAGRWKRLGHLPPDASPGDTAGLLALTTYGIIVDQTHLGGASTRAVLRRMGALETAARER